MENNLFNFLHLFLGCFGVIMSEKRGVGRPRKKHVVGSNAPGQGRPKKSTAQLMAEGKHIPNTHGYDVPMSGMRLVAPKSLNKKEVEKFNYFAEIMVAKKMDHAEYTEVLCMLAKISVEVDELTAILRKEKFVTVAANGAAKPHPLLGVASTKEKAKLYLLRELGLTPATRSKTAVFGDAFTEKTSEDDFFG